MSVFTKILTGSYDNQLHWPFLGTVMYELLNQFGDDINYSMTMDIECCLKQIPNFSLSC